MAQNNSPTKKHTIPYVSVADFAVAVHIFDKNPEIGYLLGDTFNTHFDNMNSGSSDQLAFFSNDETRDQIKRAFTALSKEFHATNSLSPTKTSEILRTLTISDTLATKPSNTTTLPKTPASTPEESAPVMTSPRIEEKKKFTVSLPSKDWETLAYLMLNPDKKKYISDAMEKHFDIKFDRYGSANPTVSPVGKISFSGPEEAVSKVEKFMEVMMDDYRNRQYFSPTATLDIARQINENGFFDRNPKQKQKQDFNKVSAPSSNDNTAREGEYRTEAQVVMAQMVDEKVVTFGIGPAGTGKTHVAMKKAVEAFMRGDVKKILLTRPAVEAGEKLGFLPGSADEKMAPYLRPLYDELEKMLGQGKLKNMMGSKAIEIVPLGTMRGRTFEDAFIILDEAQNTSVQQMKMALTRIGPNSKMVITGDVAQVDIGEPSGLVYAVAALQNRTLIGTHEFGEVDIMRSAVVKEMIGAFDEYEKGGSPAPHIEKPQPKQLVNAPKGPAKPR